MNAVVTRHERLTCKAEGVASFLPPTPLPHPIFSIFFSSQASERSVHSHRRGSSHILTPCCSHSHCPSPHPPPSPPKSPLLSETSLHITFIYSSSCCSQVAGLSDTAIQLLVSAAPLSSVMTLSLSPRCPSAARTAPPLCINQTPNEPK